MGDTKMEREFLQGKVILVVKKTNIGVVKSELRDALEFTLDWASWSIQMLAREGFLIGGFSDFEDYDTHYLCGFTRGDFERFCDGKSGVDLLAKDVRVELFDE